MVYKITLLIGGRELYKNDKPLWRLILTKFMATRMKKFMPKIIFENHGGFMHKLHILKNIVRVQEAIHSSKENKEQ